MTGHASMNHIFRTVWNHALGAMVAVSEVGTGRGKSVSQQAGSAPVSAPFFALNTAAALVAIAWAASSSIAFAAPSGGVAVVGQMTSTTQGNQTTITTQNGAGVNYSAINWQSFSVPQGTSTYFQQPNSSSVVINRVVTNTPSLVYGTLGSNGQLVLVNQAGITVGAGAVVDTAGFTASALKMSDADALAGRMRFGDGSVGGAVSVQGQVVARSGDVVLIGSSVDTGKDALVRAPNGSTILAAGQQVEITGRGLEGISMTVQAPENSAVNLGALQGNAVAIFAGTLKHSGAIQATKASLEGGRVVLKAAGDAMVDGKATIAATGTVGGSVDVLGQRVGLTDQSRIDVSGTRGGGQVRIGGDYQGKNAAVPNAQFVYVGKDVNIQANATDKGNGGRVIVWADDSTRAYGSIEAKGGAQGGDGGFVETSGKRALDVNGVRVSAAASAGKAGTWLLDPADVTISAGSGAGNMNQPSTGLFVPVSTSGSSTIYESDITGVLNNGTDVTVTTYDTTLNPTSISVVSASGNITVSAGLTWTSSAKLTLDAYNSININSGITATNGQLSLLASNRSGANSGTISNAGSNLIKVKKLEAVANGNIDITGYNEIQNLAAKSVAGAVNIESAHASGLTITNVGGTSGVSAAGDISIRQYSNNGSNGGITVGSAVNSTGTGQTQTLLGIASGSGSISIGADVQGQAVQLYTSGGALSQTGGAIKDHGSGTMLAGASSIALNSTSNDFSSVNVVTSGTFSPTTPSWIALTDANDLVLASSTVSTTAGGGISLSAGGAISLSGASLDTTNLSLYAGTGIGTSANMFYIGSVPNVQAHTSSGGVYLSSNGPLTVSGISAGGGDIVVSNIGGLTTTGLVSAATGAVTMTTEGSMTIGADGVSATGNIVLAANPVSQTLLATQPVGVLPRISTLIMNADMLLNGPITSSQGSVNLSAAGTLTQNSAVFGATGVTATAAAMVYGPGATASNAPVSYTANGSAVTPPAAPTSPVVPTTDAITSAVLVSALEDLLLAAIAEQTSIDPLQTKDPLQEGTGGEICLR